MIYIEDKVIDDVAHGFHVPAKPETLTQLQHVMSKRESNISDESQVIANDVALSSAILKTINSPFFGLSRRVSDIHQAVCFLGMNIVNDLVTALLFRNAFDSIPSCLSLERFWDDSKDVANAMTFINKNIKNKIPLECLYTIGLFHDCGIPAFSNKYSDYKETLIEANGTRCNSVLLEENKYGANHAIIGYFIAKSWHLPNEVCNIILHHHNVDFLTKITGSDEQQGYAVLKLAENLVDRNKRHCESPDWKYVTKDVLNVLGISQEEYIDLDNLYSSFVQQL
ncbi:MAG: HDOD domain-containing protein [Colwellia sp.]